MYKNLFFYLWCEYALGARLQIEKKANAKDTDDQDAIAKPVHSIISPRKFPHDTYSNKPPEYRKKIFIKKKSIK